MGGVSAARRYGCVLAAVLTLLSVAPEARAIELLEGRIQVHGYFEEVIRGINDNFSENTDLTQWQSILNIETEIDILPDGLGPVSGLSAFARVEVRYDCVWTRACGMARSADTFGNRANKLPVRLGDARSSNSTGQLQASAAPEELPGGFVTNQPRIFGPTRRLGGSRRVGGINTVDVISTLFGTAGADGLLNSPDDPARYTFQPFLDYRFAMRAIKGTDDGRGTQTLGPWLPKNVIDPIGTLRTRVNPFNARESNPITGNIGSAALPLRPAPEFNASVGGLRQGVAQGLFLPSPTLARWIQDGRENTFDQNFTQRELAWNRGAAQQQTGELKELYLDGEVLDGRLFLRIGKQTVVYGKTELFTAIDQFNPRDIALSTLPSLEESRLAVWAARGIFSLYEVGPLEDVRVELAVNIDEYTPDDLGRCGEPYSPNPVCNKTFGLFAHGITGVAIAGEERPSGWWNGWKGLQGAARLEWRWDRFSFALTDIYSYTRTPFTERLTTFERNVDPNTGRPREYGAQGACTTGNEPACLQGSEALARNPLNQQIFAVICSSSVGFSSLDRTVCAQSVFNSTRQPLPGTTITNALSVALGGGFGANILFPALAGTTAFVVPLNAGATDNLTLGVAGGLGSGPAGSLSATLSDQQEALLGCGVFYGTNCHTQGIDLLNLEASALLQSFPGIEGTSGNWDPTDASVAQPGTVGFAGGPACTRYINGRTVILPGCRGPGDAGYNPAVDGVTTGLLMNATLAPGGSPFPAQQFRNEMAALSFNFMNLLVAFSTPDSDGVIEANEFDNTRKTRTDGCSFVRPELCGSVNSFFAVTGVQHRDVRAGGNMRFGRRDMVWAGGGDVVLRYEKRNVLGLALDFAEDTTKTNWAVETTWENDLPFGDADQFGGLTNTDRYNLVISADRPTFINFLNQNRTFFFNTQWFFSYVPEYRNSFDTLGPFNVRTTFTVTTGYFQDRLLPGMTFVYDWKSNSGAALPQLQYRFTENFSATFGAAFFMGRFQGRDAALNPLSLGNRRGAHAYTNWTEQGLSPVRDRDEVFFKLRYTF